MDRARILVVDDDASVLELMVEVFAGAGYEVRCASNGAAALATMEHWLPHLIFADVAMPVLDGLGLLAEVKTWDINIEVVLTSASRPDLTRFDVEFVPKPFELRQIEEIAARLVAARIDSSGD